MRQTVSNDCKYFFYRFQLYGQMIKSNLEWGELLWGVVVKYWEIILKYVVNFLSLKQIWLRCDPGKLSTNKVQFGEQETSSLKA